MKDERAFITRINTGIYHVYWGDTVLPCKIRGKLRLGTKYPVVGDFVKVTYTCCDDFATIDEVYPQTNHLIRPQIANVDQVLVVASLKEPEVSISLIHRFLLLVASAGFKPILAISKMDLMDDSTNEYKKEFENFEKENIKVIFFSAKTGKGLDEISKLLAMKKTVITGQTGVGKSSLINALSPSFSQETGEISKALGRGKHITRVVEFLPFQDGWIADTPGFSSIEIDLDKVELSTLFIGFDAYYPKCKFRGCLHENEPQCAVKKAVEDGNISRNHYDIYIDLLAQIKERKEKFE